jgi:hypothetical protein
VIDETSPKQPDRPIVKVRSGDGTWRKLEDSRMPSGDPEVEQLWGMNLAELDAIISDESHLLHDKAVQVSFEAFEPVRAALESVDFSSFLPKMPEILPPIEASWFGKLNTWYPEWKNLLATFENNDSGASTLSPIDFDAPDIPDVTVTEAALASVDVAQEIRMQQRQLLEELLIQAQSDSQGAKDSVQISRDSLHIANESLAVSKAARNAGWWAAAAAIASVIATVVGTIITISVN